MKEYLTTTATVVTTNSSGWEWKKMQVVTDRISGATVSMRVLKDKLGKRKVHLILKRKKIGGDNGES